MRTAPRSYLKFKGSRWKWNNLPQKVHHYHSAFEQGIYNLLPAPLWSSRKQQLIFYIIAQLIWLVFPFFFRAYYTKLMSQRNIGYFRWMCTFESTFWEWSTFTIHILSACLLLCCPGFLPVPVYVHKISPCTAFTLPVLSQAHGTCSRPTGYFRNFLIWSSYLFISNPLLLI